jgi:hypothetical protein
MDSLSIIASIIITIIELLIFLSPFIVVWIAYSYVFSKLIYLFNKRYFNLNISFSRTWAITFLSGIISLIIILIFFFLSLSYSVDITTIEYFIAIIVTSFITSLIVYKYLSNANLRVAIVMSFATLLACLSFYIIAYIVVNYVQNVLLNPCYDRACGTLRYIK